MNDNSKYKKYKKKYLQVRNKLEGKGKYYVDVNDEVDILYKNKKLLKRVKSKFQKIEVYKHNFFGHILVIDDDLQLTEHDERNYHEMIVHVPMNYLEKAQRVLIIGGGDCGTLTEVLKHPNVTEVIMVEIDEEVVNMSKQYFSHLTKGLNDRRANLVIADGFKWVQDNLKRNYKSFDVIIVDSTDYTTAMKLFTDKFYENISVLLKDMGMFAFNCMSISWESGDMQDVYSTMHKYFKYANLYQTFIPTYASGHYSFCVCSNLINPRNTPINFPAFDAKKIPTEYYNKNVHLGSFYLPNKYELENLSSKERLGTTFLFDIKNVDFKILDNMDTMDSLLKLICEKYNLTVVGKSQKKFEPQGLSINYLLSESHLSVHTWPEKGKCSIDLFTCGEFKWYVNESYDLTNILISDFKISEKDIKVSSVEREI